jgi:hypothetical protein
LAGVKGFEPLIYSLGGCRLVLARLHAHYGFLRGKLVYQAFRRPERLVGTSVVSTR